MIGAQIYEEGGKREMVRIDLMGIGSIYYETDGPYRVRNAARVADKPSRC